MKRDSEGHFGAALRDCDVAGYVYKPGDRDPNMKPCDFMVWLQGYSQERDHAYVQSVWFEVKDLPPTVVNAFPFSELRPAQVAGIRDAERIGIPYWLAIYWRRHKAWTISDATKVMRWRDEENAQLPTIAQPKSIPRRLLNSRFGIDATAATLSSTLKSILLGDI